MNRFTVCHSWQLSHDTRNYSKQTCSLATLSLDLNERVCAGWWFHTLIFCTFNKQNDYVVLFFTCKKPRPEGSSSLWQTPCPPLLMKRCQMFKFMINVPVSAAFWCIFLLCRLFHSSSPISSYNLLLALWWRWSETRACVWRELVFRK